MFANANHIYDVYLPSSNIVKILMLSHFSWLSYESYGKISPLTQNTVLTYYLELNLKDRLTPYFY